MQPIYRRTPMPKCDFNKVAKLTLLKSKQFTAIDFMGPLRYNSKGYY